MTQEMGRILGENQAMSQIELISTESRLVEVVDHLWGVQRVAVDIESNAFFKYHEHICLVQLASAETVFLVDPLAIDDVRPLGDLLGNRSVEKVFHAPDYDIRSFDREWGFQVNNLFDTSIAAAFAGSTQLGLQYVVKEHAGVELAKARKLQRSDWSIRPLGTEALRYAADDVRYLLQVRETLSARLEELSRLEWAREEFARLEQVRHTPPNRETAFLAAKGSRDLDGRGLAVLGALFRFREQEASRLDRPCFKVIPDVALVQLSSEPTADFSNIKGLGRFARPSANRKLRAVIENGLRSQPVTRPQRPRSEEAPTPAERERMKSRLRTLKTWRGQLGRGLGLDPALLWPAASLERLARHPFGLQSELASPEVRSWQKREFRAALKSFLVNLS